ncbi:Flagellar biosynthesis protein FliO [Burkholderiales bacterium 8X]|nr:Flagellar biosynthesis protein FliO [Burkholderiales bacterium 8X]
MTQSLVTIVIFIGLMMALPLVLKRLQAKRGALLGGAGGVQSKLLSTVAIGPQQRVVTVEVGPEDARTCLVLGVTAQSITCLHTAPVRTEIAQRASIDHA